MSFFSFMRNLSRRKRDLTDEIESHLRMATADRVACGESPEKARREAVREFGNVPLVADVTRERWGWMWLELLLADVRFGWRQLWKRKVTTVAAVLSDMIRGLLAPSNSDALKRAVRTAAMRAAMSRTVFGGTSRSAMD